jgi:RNase H-fold protein (predicted Holliday junction resolvase)
MILKDSAKKIKKFLKDIKKTHKVSFDYFMEKLSTVDALFSFLHEAYAYICL